MKLSEIKGEQALDVLVELIDPAAEIFGDKEVATAWKSGVRINAVKVMITNHKKAVIRILAILDGENPETYEVNVLTLPVKLLEILNDPELASLFTSAERTVGATSSASASVKAE